jgi:hypothetical protein
MVPVMVGGRPNHPRLLLMLSAKTWMQISIGMTVWGIDHESELLAIGIIIRS